MVSQKTKYLGIVLILFLLLLFYKCPFQFMTGLPCPGCNMKTSLYYLLKGNIQLSLYYHALLIPTLICGILCLFKPEKRKMILIMANTLALAVRLSRASRRMSAFCARCMKRRILHLRLFITWARFATST